MVYGLEPAKINADKVFNVFCLYGNVERVSPDRGAVYY
jgi:heterogeneous nuclear ribonucleoprotein L